MVKQRRIPKRAVFKILALALFLSVSCSVEEDLLQSEQSKRIIHKKLSLEEVRNEKYIMSKLSDYTKGLRKMNSKSRTNDSLIIDISFANYIETDDFISYTFSMPTTSVPIRNFLLKKNKADTLGYQGYILNYDLTPEEKVLFENKELHDVSNKVTSIKLNGEYNLGVFGRNVRSNNTCYGWVGICHLGWGGGLDSGGHVASSRECVVSNYLFTSFSCSDEGGGGSGGYTPPTTTPEPPTTPTPPNTGGGREDIVVSPVNSNGGTITPVQITEPTEDCIKLKDLFEIDKQNIRPKLTELKQKILTGAKNEWSTSHKTEYAYDPITNTNSLTYTNEPLSEGTPNTVIVTTGTRYPSSSHSHPKDGYPIFSWQDLRLLRNTYLETAELFKPLVSIQIVCFNETTPTQQLAYSLTINDFDKLNSKIEADWSKEELNGLDEEAKIKTIHIDLGEDYDQNKDNLELFFLQKFKNYGIDLYKANNELTNWTKLSLNITASKPNGELNQTPCP